VEPPHKLAPARPRVGVAPARLLRARGSTVHAIVKKWRLAHRHAISLISLRPRRPLRACRNEEQDGCRRA